MAWVPPGVHVATGKTLMSDKMFEESFASTTRALPFCEASLASTHALRHSVPKCCNGATELSTKADRPHRAFFDDAPQAARPCKLKSHELTRPRKAVRAQVNWQFWAR